MRRFVNMAVCMTALAGFATHALAQDGDCDRHCLGGLLEDYLDAVVADDPSGASLSSAYRQTENAVAIPLGGGVWKSVVGLGAMRRSYFDPVTGNADFFGVVDEGDAPAIANVRVRVQNGEITEAEWHIARATDPGIRGEPGGTLFDVENLTENPPAGRSVPARNRLPRETLVAIANSYFDGITAADADVIRAHGGCSRFENGQNVTGRPLPPERSDDGFEGRSDCTSGQGSFNVVFVAARRYLVVDVEAQVVVGSAVFIREPGNDKRRNFLAEVFYVDAGLIRNVYAAMSYVPPTRPVPNWPPYEGNFPLPESFGH